MGSAREEFSGSASKHGLESPMGHSTNLLGGVRVVDLTRLLPGGFCSSILRELGADVLKVEEPGRGDYVRSMGSPNDGFSHAFSMLNVGKSSIGLNLKSRDGREILEKLISDCDVLLESFRPGVMEKLGFSFARVRRINPRIVYCSISAFGKSSKFNLVPAHDLNFQALGGTLFAFGDKEPGLPFVQYADLCSGLYACIGILAGLSCRARRAIHVDVPMFQSLTSLLIVPLSRYLATGKDNRIGEGLLFGGSPFYGLYQTKDRKYIALGAVEESFQRNLLKELGLQDLANAKGGRGKALVRQSLRKVFATKTRNRWADELITKDVCATPVLSLAESIESPWGDSIFSGGVLKTPFARSRTKGKLVKAPTLGEQTEKILMKYGYSTNQISDMKRHGAVA